MFADIALFFGLWLQKLLRIAAITPNSTRSAATMTGLVAMPSAQIPAHSALGV
jgi:hypothetical protein